ncbi:TetR/AcrR family transcriptional regulator [Aeromicrobium fastidiosum]|uniref:TetR/AcrR family transcriptional regulator n=1 Tax=Aeromicrobium fastidiosum TaxID=52699 RepID=A0A641AKC1_9ACTN|nr:TetR/AcrR family transcriptional regulator [Aeromicrobium fastidiosum]KAA1373607.1 TetR/AcrR family transcriptional regulator [Aeromicrobium fastidiosum]MBP2391156.1 AcrR family transcriptional regulator [Aeromicrobium fastidiosum]
MTTITARERLINAAVEAFSEKGFAATTTRDIASRAGMSPAAVYVHHDSKESLLYTVSLDGHRSALEIIQRAAAASTDPVDRIRTMVFDFSLWHADHSRVGRIVQWEYHALTPEHRAEVGAIRRSIERTMQDALADGVQQGVLDAEDVPGTAFSLLSLGVDLVRWFEPGGSRSGRELATLHAELAVRMTRRTA